MRSRQLRIRLFMSHVNGREERYIEKKARDGWHLRRALAGCIYTFERGEPEDVVVKMDFHSTASSPPEDYLTLYADMGWTYICRYHEWPGNCWYYFKCPRTPENSEPEIYSDTESRILHYRSYIRFIYFLAAVLAAGFIAFDVVMTLLVWQVWQALLFGVIFHVLFLAAFFGLWIRHIKKKIRALENTRL